MSSLVPRWTLGMRRRSDKALEEEATKRSNLLRIQCWNEALNAYGTSYIFQRRARSWTRRVQWITYIGFVVPMIVGLLVLAYGHLKSLPVIVAIAAAIGVGQVVISLWGIVGGWVSGAAYAATSAMANDLLAASFAELASNPPGDAREFRHRYELLNTEGNARTEQDFQQGVSEAEKRMGMRAALRKYQRKCAGCGQVPLDMQATGCSVCGKYRYRIR
jgi:mobilome CxxCx(11)CxxC protein